MRRSGCPICAIKLDQGDYSYKYINIDGEECFMDSEIVVERKMNLNELANNFGRERKRFEREFNRAKELNTKVYLIIEDDSWEDAYNGTYGKDKAYRSRLNPQSMIGSLHAWENRYNLHVRFCNRLRTGRMIRDICYYHLKEILEKS